MPLVVVGGEVPVYVWLEVESKAFFEHRLAWSM